MTDEEFKWQSIKNGNYLRTTSDPEFVNMIDAASRKAEQEMFNNFNNTIFADSTDYEREYIPPTFWQHVATRLRVIYYKIKFRLTVLFTGECPDCKVRQDW